jgi:hypothetical protein
MRARTFLLTGLTHCAVCALLACAAQGAAAQQEGSRGETEGKKKEPFPVTMAVSAEAPDGDGKQKLTVTLTIGKGYYVFANPPDNEDLDDLRPILRVAGKNVKGARVTYPRGEVVKDKILGDYRVYRGTVTLEAVVTRPPRDAEPLTVSILLRPFDRSGCRWLPTRLEKRLP